MTFVVANITIDPTLLILWGFLVGLIFSLVGAAGGILASVGLISVVGLSQPNMVKPMAQMLTIISPFIAVPAYFKQGRFVISLALWLGAGGLIGALLGSTYSTYYMADSAIYKPVFGAFTILIAAQLIWGSIVNRKHQLNSPAARSAAIYEYAAARGNNLASLGVKHKRWSISQVKFLFAGQEFEYHPWKPFVAGLMIAVVSSALGVGGGFLLVPFMASLMGLPMFVIAATAGAAVVISSIASVSNYVALGVNIDFTMMGFLIFGVVGGSFMGPLLSKYVRHSYLKILLCLILVFIGIRYLTPVLINL
jgi:uncharacterized protein